MPAKAGKGFREINKKYEQFVQKIAGPVTEQTMTLVMVRGMAFSKELAPIEFGLLVNSQFWEVEPSGDGWRGRGGYTANYALALEAPTPGGKMDNWQPVAPENKAGNGWNPISGQGFLRLGFTGNESGPVIQQTIENGYKAAFK